MIHGRHFSPVQRYRIDNNSEQKKKETGGGTTLTKKYNLHRYAVLPCPALEDPVLCTRLRRYSNDKEEAREYAKEIKGLLMTIPNPHPTEDYREK